MSLTLLALLAGCDPTLRFPDEGTDDTDVPSLVGKACPALVYPNYEDWGFAKVTLDERSFETARASLSPVAAVRRPRGRGGEALGGCGWR